MIVTNRHLELCFFMAQEINSYKSLINIFQQ